MVNNFTTSNMYLTPRQQTIFLNIHFSTQKIPTPFVVSLGIPHLDMMAVAHHDHHVYIYEKKETEWHCQVIAHQHMKDITCMEWKNKASGLLAVGCQQGVCVWTLERNEFTSKRPRFHPLASMQYLQYPGHDSISSLTWDPTPASYLLAVASAVSSTLVIHDVQLNQTVPLKRFGKGNILLRWSPNGEFLFEGGS